MKPIELFFGVLRVPVDFCALVLAALAAYSIRFSTRFAEIRPVLERIQFSEYVQLVASIAAFWIIIFAAAGLYRLKGTRRMIDEWARVFLACSTGILFVIVTIFFQREFFASRFIVLAVWALSIVFVIVGRALILLVERFLLTRGIGVHRVFLLGSDPAAEELAHAFRAHRWLGYTVVARVDSWDDAARARLQTLADQRAVDEVIQAEPKLSRGVSMEIINLCEERHMTFKYIADLYATHTANIAVSTIGGTQIIELKATRLDGWGKVWKRVFDIIVSLVIIVVLSPVMFIVALAIVFESGLPVFFRRLDDGSPVVRIGQGGIAFPYLKFRSMRVGMHQLRYTALAAQNVREGPLVKIKDDPRVTRVGKFIRRWSIDEFPELFLVLIGSMSLVGPRPHLPEEVAQYARHHKKLLAIKPGITGMAQISGRSDLSFEDEARLDTYYIEHWSPWLDLYILLKTPVAVVQHRKAE